MKINNLDRWLDHDWIACWREKWKKYHIHKSDPQKNNKTLKKNL